MLSFFKGKKKKILIVEDDAYIREMLVAILRTSGFAVIETKDGVAGYAQAVKERPDLILMDIMLPTVSGVDTVALIRSHAKTKATPIIMCTAKSKLEDVEKSLNAGANDYITKPFEVSQLRAKVAKFLSLEAD